MIDMHIHIQLDKDTDAAAEGAKLKELLNAALIGEVIHTCNCRPALPIEAEEPSASEEPKSASEEPKSESEEPKSEGEEPKKKVKSAKKGAEPELKIEDVRAVLAEYRAKGGELKTVLKPYGAKLTDVKKEDYPALLKDAKEALSKLSEAE